MAALALVVFGLMAGGSGLALLVGETSPDLALTLFYAGAPVSAIFGVLGGGVPIAWPLDLMVWVVAGMGAPPLARRLRSPVWVAVTAIAAAAGIYGFALSQLVTID